MKSFYKQKILWVLWIMLLPLIGAMGQEPFITVWKSSNPSSEIEGKTTSTVEQIWFPGIGTNYTIEWEEIGAETTHYGTLTNITTTEGNPVLINFGTPQSDSIYRVKVLPTGFETIRFINRYFDNIIYGDYQKIIDIAQWGNVAWTTMQAAFKGCSNLTMSATDAPNLSGVTDMSSMFERATSFNQPPNNWDVSNVTDMHMMFSEAIAFNQPLNGWNVSNVNNMWKMFYYASAFNQPLDNWNVGNVTDMASMFWCATAFNQPLNSWNVSNVTYMGGMFYKAIAFDQPLDNWNVGNVISMWEMLSNCNMCCQNYDSTLIGWAALPMLKKGVTLGAIGRNYSAQAAIDARNILTAAPNN